MFKFLTFFHALQKKYFYNNLFNFLEFAHEWAKQYEDQGWTTQTEEQVKQSLRSRIVEIKMKNNVNLQSQMTD